MYIERSKIWVEQRIIPSDRQNIAEILRDNNLKEYDEFELLMLAMGLLLVYKEYGGVQIYSFLAIPLLWAYNGKRENILPKYFFYIFYPLHLAVILAVKYLILT